MVVTVFFPGEIYGYVYTNKFSDRKSSDAAAQYRKSDKVTCMTTAGTEEA